MEWENYFSHSERGDNARGHSDAQALHHGGADISETGIDLNEQLIYNKTATFFFRMNGDAMADAGIGNGDVLIVDKSLKASNGKIIVANINGELVVRRFQQTVKGPVLVADNPRYENIDVGEFTQFHAFGLVTCVIRILEKGLLGSQRPQQYGRKKRG